MHNIQNPEEMHGQVFDGGNIEQFSIRCFDDNTQGRDVKLFRLVIGEELLRYLLSHELIVELQLNLDDIQFLLLKFRGRFKHLQVTKDGYIGLATAQKELLQQVNCDRDEADLELSNILLQIDRANVGKLDLLDILHSSTEFSADTIGNRLEWYLSRGFLERSDPIDEDYLNLTELGRDGFKKLILELEDRPWDKKASTQVRQLLPDEIDVFISYPGAHFQIAKNLHEQLLKLDIKSFLFTVGHRERWGDSVFGVLGEAIVKCGKSIIIVAEESRHSKFQLKEIDALLNLETYSDQDKIFPYLHELTHKKLSEMFPFLGPKPCQTTSDLDPGKYAVYIKETLTTEVTSTH